MTQREFTPKDVAVDNDAQIVNITWADGHVSKLPITRLRGYCPCAECQGHGGEIRYIDNVTHGIDGAEMVGRYAIMFSFTDGHSTGIYRWDALRKLDPVEAEKWGAPEEFMRG